MCAPQAVLALGVTAVLGKAGRWDRGHPQCWPWPPWLQAVVVGTQSGCAGQRGLLGHLGDLGQDGVTKVPEKPDHPLPVQLPPPKGLALGFLSQLQVFLRCSVCVSRVSPSLEVLGFSDFRQLLMTCETEQGVFWGLCASPC